MILMPSGAHAAVMLKNSMSIRLMRGYPSSGSAACGRNTPAIIPPKATLIRIQSLKLMSFSFIAGVRREYGMHPKKYKEGKLTFPVK